MLPDDGRVVSNFIVQALRGEPITIYGTGSQTRSFCYVDDLIEGIIRLVDMPEDFSGPVNLGNPSEISVRELATQIVEACESDSEIRFLELPQDDPTQRCPDITLAKTALKWAPEVSLDTGLRKTIEWFRNNLSDFGRE